MFTCIWRGPARRRALRLSLVALASACPIVAAACGSSDGGNENKAGATSSSSAGGEGAGGSLYTPLDAGTQPQTATITADSVSTRFVTREHFLAGGEMQISGEPLAEAMGRQLASYSRDFLPTDVYFDHSPMSIGFWIDTTGFSTAVESYEYSKQPMNNVALESGAGTALVHGPLVDPSGAGGPQATAALAAKIQHFAKGSNAFGKFVFPAGTYPSNNGLGNDNPLGVGDPAKNPLGWPGIWPTLHAFKSFEPSIAPTSAIDLQCSISSDDDPGGSGALGCADYECDYSTLNLPDRSTQVDPTVTPGADGFSAWKYGLWVLNYLQIMHDSTEAAVASVDDDTQLSSVGQPGNTVVGDDGTGAPTAAGTFLGSSNIEGFQAQMFIEEIDNRAEDWVKHFVTTDGQHLKGFPDLKSALAYDYASPLAWFPGEIAVTETDDGSGFPVPKYSISSSDSHLLDLVGMAMGYSEFFALTDTSNADVGGSQTAEVYFDGDPFPADDQEADGEPTLHDRALAVLRVAVIDMDRMHADPKTGIFVDDVTMKGSTVARGTTVTTPDLAYAVIGLRTAKRAISSQLELYSNNVPDTSAGVTPLDALPIKLPSDSTMSFSARLSQMLKTQADALYDHLTDESGRAYDGWDAAKSAPIDDKDTLDAHTAAVRGLFAAYLSTGDTKYRDRALAVYQRLDAVFYDPSARIYSDTPAPSDTIVYTPLRFALLQSTLRDVYELVATRPGGEALEPVLEARIGRLDKLILNGWDDRDENRVVDWPGECVNFTGEGDAGLPHGGLQMGERTLTGEIGSYQEQLDGGTRTATSDREHDCVPEIDDAKLPSALADSITFHVHRAK